MVVTYIFLGIFVVILVAIAYAVVKNWQRLKTFIEEVKFEMNKVAWPSRDDVINSTVLVGVTTVALTLVVYAFDFIFSRVVQILI